MNLYLIPWYLNNVNTFENILVIDGSFIGNRGRLFSKRDYVFYNTDNVKL